MVSKVFRQSLSLLLSGCLIYSSISPVQAAPALADLTASVSNLPQFQLVPPASMGHLVDYFNAPSQPRGENRLVVLVQDLHSHYGAQKNIAALLEFLSTKLDRDSKSQGPEKAAPAKVPFALAVEGASGRIDSSFLALFPDKKVRLSAADYLMREGELSGTEYFAVDRGLPKLLSGVESATLYETHRDLFRKTFYDRHQLRTLLKDLNEGARLLRSRTYKGSVKEIAKALDELHSGKMTGEAFVIRIGTLAKTHRVDVDKDFPNVARFLANASPLSPDALRASISSFMVTIQDKLSGEEKKNLTALAKNNDLAPYLLYVRDLIVQRKFFMAVPLPLARHLEYVRVLQSGLFDPILFEASELAFAIQKKAATSPKEKDLLLLDHDLGLLERAVDLQVTEPEVHAFAQRLNAFVILATRILGERQKAGVSVPDAKTIRELALSSIDYYALAVARNKPMIDNTLALMQDGKSSGPSKRVAESPKTAVLVAGGFHTSQLCALLRERNVSYVVLTPSVDSVTPRDHDLYIKRLNGIVLRPRDVFERALPYQTAWQKKFVNPLAPSHAIHSGRYGVALLNVAMAGVVVYQAVYHQQSIPEAIQAIQQYISTSLSGRSAAEANVAVGTLGGLGALAAAFADQNNAGLGGWLAGALRGLGLGTSAPQDPQELKRQAQDRLIAQFRHAYQTQNKSPHPISLVRAALFRDLNQPGSRQLEIFDNAISIWVKEYGSQVVFQNQKEQNDFILEAYEKAFPNTRTNPPSPFQITFEGKALVPDENGYYYIALAGGTSQEQAAGGIVIQIDPPTGFMFIFQQAMSVQYFDMTVGSMDGFTVGRDHGSDFQISDPRISRRHATFVRIPRFGFNVVDGVSGVASTQGTWPRSLFTDSDSPKAILSERARQEHLKNLPEFAKQEYWKTFVRTLGSLSRLENAGNFVGSLMTGDQTFAQALNILGFAPDPQKATVGNDVVGKKVYQGVYLVDDRTNPTQETAWERLISEDPYRLMPTQYFSIPVVLADRKPVVLIPRRLFQKLTKPQQDALLWNAESMLQKNAWEVEPSLSRRSDEMVAQLARFRAPEGPEDKVNKAIREARFQMLEIPDWSNPEAMRPIRDVVLNALSELAVADPDFPEADGTPTPSQLNSPELLDDILNLLENVPGSDPAFQYIYHLRQSLSRGGTLIPQGQPFLEALRNSMLLGYIPKLIPPAKKAFDEKTYQNSWYGPAGKHETISLREVQISLTNDHGSVFRIFIDERGLPVIEWIDTRTGKARHTENLGLGIYRLDLQGVHEASGWNSAGSYDRWVSIQVLQNANGQYELRHYHPQESYRVKWNDPIEGFKGDVLFGVLSQLRESLDLKRDDPYYNQDDIKAELAAIRREYGYLVARWKRSDYVSSEELSENANALFSRITRFNADAAYAIRKRNVMAQRASKTDARHARLTENNVRSLLGQIESDLDPYPNKKVGFWRTTSPTELEKNHDRRRQEVWRQMSSAIGRLKTEIQTLERSNDLFEEAKVASFRDRINALQAELDGELIKLNNSFEKDRSLEAAQQIAQIAVDVFWVEDPQFLSETQETFRLIAAQAKKLEADIQVGTYDATPAEATSQVADLREKMNALYKGKTNSRGNAKEVPIRPMTDVARDLLTKNRRLLTPEEVELIYINERNSTLGEIFVSWAPIEDAANAVQREADYARMYLLSAMTLQAVRGSYFYETQIRDIQRAFNDAERQLRGYGDIVKNYRTVLRTTPRGYGSVRDYRPEVLDREKANYEKALAPREPDDGDRAAVYAKYTTQYMPDPMDPLTLINLPKYKAVIRAGRGLGVYPFEQVRKVGGMVIPREWYRPFAATAELVLILLGAAAFFYAGAEKDWDWGIRMALGGPVMGFVLAGLHKIFNPTVLKDAGVRTMHWDSAILGTGVVASMSLYSEGSLFFSPMAGAVLAMAASLWHKHERLNRDGTYALFGSQGPQSVWDDAVLAFSSLLHLLGNLWNRLVRKPWAARRARRANGAVVAGLIASAAIAGVHAAMDAANPADPAESSAALGALVPPEVFRAKIAPHRKSFWRSIAAAA